MAKAAERLAALVDPAITRLTQLLDDPTPGIVLAAERGILDRAGYKATDKIQTEGRTLSKSSTSTPLFLLQRDPPPMA